ncbi:hypothetical protein ACIRSU_20410 [Streptomyces sp. NPDC101160]|uniref:hypothetical protein n=1 Tax=Streptomyces sp. NPDC101160 TaxID=3366118 RepID=UPI00380EEC97
MWESTVYDPMNDPCAWPEYGTGIAGVPATEGWDGWDDERPGPLHLHAPRDDVPPHDTMSLGRMPLDTLSLDAMSLDAMSLDDLPFDALPHQPVPEPGHPARRRHLPPVTSWPLLFRSLFGMLTIVTVTAVCVLDWLLCYHPLLDLAVSRVPHGLDHLWPAIVYAPWLVGTFSVLRSALEARRLAHAWAVVVVFSGIATGLCVFEACRTPADLLDIVVAGLPPVTAAVCLHQLVRQLTAASRARRPAPRHTARRVPRQRRR